YFRPVEIDCWYPATTSSTATMRFGEFLHLFQDRANRFQHDTVYSSLAAEMAQYLSVGLHLRDSTQLSGSSTHTYYNAPRSAKPAPIILYFCAYNGMCYENIALFESLAARGYIVASITSVGRYPGNMTTDPADLLEQTTDAGFALGYFRRSGWID